MYLVVPFQTPSGCLGLLASDEHPRPFRPTRGVLDIGLSSVTSSDEHPRPFRRHLLDSILYEYAAVTSSDEHPRPFRLCWGLGQGILREVLQAPTSIPGHLDLSPTSELSIRDGSFKLRRASPAI